MKTKPNLGKVLTLYEMTKTTGGMDIKPPSWNPISPPQNGSPDPNEDPREFIGPPYIPRPANPFAPPPSDLSDLMKATSDLSSFGRSGIPTMLGD